MKYALRPLALALATLCLASPVLAADKAAKPAGNKPVATVNGKAIPANRADVLLANQLSQGQANSPELQNAVREELVRREILTQEALKKGVDKKSDVQGQLDLARQGVLIGAYLNEYARNIKITDEDVNKEYDTIKGTMGDKEYLARHILVEKEGEAKEIIEKLKKGERFEDLAKASKDPGSKDRGGELGWANKASYVPAFSDALVKLQKGKFTEMAVQSNFGWHVIQLDDVRDLKAPPLEEVKQQIVQRMRQQGVEKHIMDLRSKAKVE